LAVFTAAYPGSVARRYDSVETGDTMFFKIEAQEGSKRRDVTYNNPGDLVKIEDLIATTDLPATAQHVIQTDYAIDEVTYAAKITQGDRVTYQVTVKKSETLFGLAFDSAGKLTSAHEVKVNIVLERGP